MCSVAAGFGDVYFEVGIHVWDMAAGDIIIREAGGTVVDTEGKSYLFYIMHCLQGQVAGNFSIINVSRGCWMD